MKRTSYHRKYKRKWRAKNRAHYNALGRKWYAQLADKKERSFEYRLRSRYGITVEQYEALLQKQGGACAVCQRAANQFTRRLAVDHDHRTLAIRGLLCTNCNRALVGRHREGDLLRSAADYLDNHDTGLFAPENRPKRRRKKKS